MYRNLPYLASLEAEDLARHAPVATQGQLL
jgi:hypothetical protein